MTDPPRPAMPVAYVFLETPADDQIRQIIGLYQAEGWWKAGEDEDLVRRIVVGSHCFLLACAGPTIVGMGRAISDRASDAYLQDVTVRADFRGQGIGTEILGRLVARLHRDGLRWIGLIAERDAHPFYERQGFAVMPSARPMLFREAP